MLQPTSKLPQDAHVRNLQARLMPLTMMSNSGAALNSLAVLKHECQKTLLSYAGWGRWRGGRDEAYGPENKDP